MEKDLASPVEEEVDRVHGLVVAELREEEKKMPEAEKELGYDQEAK